MGQVQNDHPHPAHGLHMAGLGQVRTAAALHHNHTSYHTFPLFFRKGQTASVESRISVVPVLSRAGILGFGVVGQTAFP
jgi:hypothetical protein